MNPTRTAAFIVFFALARCAAAQITVHETNRGQDFELAAANHAAPIVVDPADARVVQNAAALLADDIQRVTSQRPSILHPGVPLPDTAVFIGTLGQSSLIDRLVSENKLDVSALRGKWETYLIITVQSPASGVQRALVIVGSDRRGTAYGTVTISEAIGVSPWYWWADAPIAKKSALYLDTSKCHPDGPVVKYRGIFINDEDWSIKPWAAKTFDKNLDNVGPKTYARVFELLLRLKANYCWPAMHSCSRAFNTYPDDKQIADDWGIVMGSSHCEPLLRDNVDEWKRFGKGEWNWVTNRDEVIDYLRDRVEQNGKFENVWTLGMRGISDGPMAGGGSLDQQTKRLEDVITEQRKLLASLAGGDPSKVPQVFVPYKEVLNIYRNGMHLPDDVTIMWPDDNQGYIRRLSTPQEQSRSGGGGIYFHCSYWGSPKSYLWLDSTPPMQTWLEMTKAASFNCDRMWVVNVRGIKAVEKGATYFLNLAWNPADPALTDQKAWLTRFAAENISPQYADEIAGVLGDYYALCAMARPEHLARNIEDDPLYDPTVMKKRVAACDALYLRAAAIQDKLPPEARDAYFELVLYPVSGMTATNIKVLAARQARRLNSTDASQAAVWAKRADDAWAQVQADTQRYNDQIAGGKWKWIVNNEAAPAVDIKSSSLTAPVTSGSEDIPHISSKKSSADAAPATGDPSQPGHLRVADAAVLPGNSDAHWQRIDGMGYDNTVMVVEPRTLKDVDELSKSSQMPGLQWKINRPTAESATLVVHAIPAHAPLPGGTLRCAVSINGDVHWVEFKDDDENGKTWAARVLLRQMSQSVHIKFRDGANTITLRAMGAGVVVDSVDVIAE